MEKTQNRYNTKGEYAMILLVSWALNLMILSMSFIALATASEKLLHSSNFLLFGMLGGSWASLILYLFTFYVGNGDWNRYDKLGWLAGFIVSTLTILGPTFLL